MFPQEVFTHPAKANIFLIQELWRYLTEPGQSIIDPFGGTGTLLLAARDGRKVVLIDVEPQFVEMQNKTVQSWKDQGVDLADVYTYQGDNRQVLEKIQFLCDASIFSPPYADTLLGGYKDDGVAGRKMEKTDMLDKYGGETASALNMGRLNPFHFSHAMETLLKRLAARLVSGAPVASA